MGWVDSIKIEENEFQDFLKMWLLCMTVGDILFPALGNTQPTQAGDETACAEGSRQEQPGCLTDELELCKQAEASEQTENNSEIANVLGATSAKKSQIHKKRLSELGFTEADDNLMSQEMFVSVEGNQFKWNGKGSFGIFFF